VVTIYARPHQSAYSGHTAWRQLLEPREDKREQSFSVDVDAADPHARLLTELVVSPPKTASESSERTNYGQRCRRFEWPNCARSAADGVEDRGYATPCRRSVDEATLAAAADVSRRAIRLHRESLASLGLLHVREGGTRLRLAARRLDTVDWPLPVRSEWTPTTALFCAAQCQFDHSPDTPLLARCYTPDTASRRVDGPFDLLPRLKTVGFPRHRTARLRGSTIQCRTSRKHI
jgi:hypothetical protein